jgi:alcohol dehydrogenase YqhD (iron-dependent ADH family)
MGHLTVLTGEYPYRWVYVSRSLQRDSDLVDIKNIVKTASESGLNGMVLAAGLDRLDGRDPEYYSRLKQVRQLCKQRDFEIIPIVLSVGYGGSVLAQDKNLAAGLPVKDALFVVQNNRS